MSNSNNLKKIFRYNFLGQFCLCGKILFFNKPIMRNQEIYYYGTR